MNIFYVLSNMLCLLLHVTDAESFPKPLSKKAEQELILKAENGDEAARKKLIEHNLRLVAHISKKYYTATDEQDDLISIGTIGLIKAIDKFDLEQPVMFSTYAVPMIIGEIRRYMRDNSSIRVSRSLRDTAYKVIYAKENYIKKNFKQV